MMRLLLALLLGAGISISPSAEAAGTQNQAGTPNRLIASGSPYLLQHAYNPVHWFPWGPEAIEKARRENKPVFISVGYSTCFWCHVANRSLFQNPEIAALMNSWFVNIKIDREQRPDLDRVLMEATLILTGSRGWPNNLFLTPDLEPFLAGSYFPPEPDDFGRPGFPDVLKQVHADWTTRRALLTDKGRTVVARIRESHRPAPRVPIAPEDWRRAGAQDWLARTDAGHGGFVVATGAKFPQTPALAFLLAEQRIRPRAQLLAAIRAALDAMSAGGIHDHVGGGFHRYAIEPTWSIPHFEKMLYDNAQLLSLYAEAHTVTGDPRYRRVAEDIAAHLARDKEAGGGGWFTALDAASGHEEGEIYLWRREEIETRLGPQTAQRLFEAFELRPVASRRADFDLGLESGVLRLKPGARPPPEFERIREILLAARRERPQPARDEKLVIALNGLAITALADAGRMLQRPQWIARAERAGERLWRVAWDDARARLAHEVWQGRAQGEGLLEDYALFARGLLALAGATNDARWRKRAERLIDAALSTFSSGDGGLYASREAGRSPLPLLDVEDYAYPSGTSATLEALLMLGGQRHLIEASRLLQAVSGRLADQPQRWPALLRAMARHDPAVRRAVALAPQSAIASVVTAPDPATDSAARVTVIANLRPQAGADLLEVELQIEAGWHLNANPASFDYLVPTKLLIENALPRRIVYPPGKTFRAQFVRESIQVYDGKLTIRAEFPPGSTGKLRVRLSVQACNETVCLPPSIVPVAPRRSQK